MADSPLFDFQDPEFRRYLAIEDFIETFLEQVEQEMNKQALTKLGLAKRTGHKYKTMDRFFKRTAPILARDMVNIAFHLGMHLEIKLTAGDLPDYLDPTQKQIASWKK